ncbi:hypothetical protein Tco_1364834, partial [Tanacetum coccineum]
ITRRSHPMADLLEILLNPRSHECKPMIDANNEAVQLRIFTFGP